MAAEVVNLERNILITGDHDRFESTHQGIHTGTFMADPGMALYTKPYFIK